MILIIDGYNLLKSISNKSFIDKLSIDKFIKKLEKYKKLKHHKIIVVFDGGDFSWSDYTKLKSKIIVIYSGQKVNADNYIIKYLKDNKNKDILVISSDNEISSFAQSLNIPSINSDLFYHILSQSLKNKNKVKGLITNSFGKTIKLSKNNNPELDKLMENSIVEDKDFNEIEFNKSLNVNDKNVEFLSKIEKRLLNIIKKL